MKMKIRLPAAPLLTLLIGALVLVAMSYVGGSIATAHGKEISLKVSSFAPDPQEPLVRLYRVRVIFAGDREPVTDAKVQLTATRQGSGPRLEAVHLEPLNEPGFYAAQVTFPLFGTWDVTFEVQEPGEGEAIFIEDLIPAGPTRESSEVRQQVLEIFFRFNWTDVAAIFVRVSHTLGSFVWFGLTGVILFAYVFLPPASRTPVFRKLSSVFLPAGVVSLVLLGASGVYTAAFGAPIRPPGVFDLDVMLQIPFGAQYLGVIAFKAVALAACGVLVFRMARALKMAAIPAIGGGSMTMVVDVAVERLDAVAALQRRLIRLAIVNAVIGLSLMAAIVIAIYLHNISHLAVFLPE